MRHGDARRIIARLLQGQGFGEQAICQASMASLQDLDDCPDALKELLALVDDLGTDAARPYHGPLLQASIPRDERELCAQLAPAIADRPVDVGLSLASLSALCQLWPHVASDERQLLRTRFLNGLWTRTAPDEAVATRERLTGWQRLLPTAMGGNAPNMASLQALLTEPTPEGAYRVLCEHIDPRVDLRTLGRVLGTLGVAMLRQFHDRDGQALHVLLGAVALERLVSFIDPQVWTVLAAQLAHQLWWCRRGAHLSPILTCIDPTRLGLGEAVASGDVTLAQRAARAASAEPARFWAEVWALLGACVAQRDDFWPRALGAVSAIAWRSGRDAVSPDDAAALATVFADIAHHRERIFAP